MIEIFTDAMNTEFLKLFESKRAQIGTLPAKRAALSAMAQTRCIQVRGLLNGGHILDPHRLVTVLSAELTLIQFALDG